MDAGVLKQVPFFADASDEEAEAFTLTILHVFEKFLREELAIPTIPGRKSDAEKFAGAQPGAAPAARDPDANAAGAGDRRSASPGRAATRATPSEYASEVSAQDTSLETRSVQRFSARGCV